MTDQNVEAVVREAFHSREDLVAGGQENLLAAVRGRVRRRRMLAVTASGVATLAVLAGVMSLSGQSPFDGRPPLGTTAAPGRASEPAPPGWRLESSLGVELIVPDGWETNDFGCGMTAKPSVVRGVGATTACLTPEPPSKELAIIERPTAPPFLGGTGRAVSIDGVAATRADGRVSGDRYAGWILIPSLDVRVEVRTREAATTSRILGSVHLADPDHVGCATRRPAVTPPTVASGDVLVSPDPAAIGICNYGDQEDVLQSSTELTGDAARTLAAALNAARPGRNADPPGSTCHDVRSPVPNVVLLVRATDRRVTTLWVTYSSCAGRGLDNGVRQAQVTQTLLRLIMGPVHTGYAFIGDLPQ